MSVIERELRDIALDLSELAAKARKPEIVNALEAIGNACRKVGEAWSGSWLGHHARIYHFALQKPSPTSKFSQLWGLMERPYVSDRTTGIWLEFDVDIVEAEIQRLAGRPDMEGMYRFWDDANSVVRRCRDSLLSILDLHGDSADAGYLEGKRNDIATLLIRSPDQILSEWRPSNAITKDVEALGKGPQRPPHLNVLAQVESWNDTIVAIQNLRDCAEQLEAHFARKTMQDNSTSTQGSRVFVGHGHSAVWRELKEFLQDRLGLQVDEYSRVSTAGVTTTTRLQSMLNDAGFAFLIMTGEDEVGDGKLRARENVVHEVGLFQGKLGFEKAIVLLEEGCEEFSNIEGLGQIRFPQGNLGAASEEIRKVLEREGIISPGTAQ